MLYLYYICYSLYKWIVELQNVDNKLRIKLHKSIIEYLAIVYMCCSNMNGAQHIVLLELIFTLYYHNMRALLRSHLPNVLESFKFSHSYCHI